MAKNQKPQPEGWRTTRTERINYYIGDIGRSLEGYIVTAMMTLFLLFQGIDLIKVSAAILAVKIIDALDDIIFGFFIDKLDIKKSKLLGKLEERANICHGIGRPSFCSRFLPLSSS